LDEYWSLYDAGGATMGPLSPTGVWNRVAEQDPWQSPGYYLLLNLWGKNVGWSEFATRALSLFMGLLSVAWTYRLGHDLVSPFGGIAAAVTLGFSAYFIYYLHEMRGYTLYVFFTAWMVCAYWRLLKHGGKIKALLLLLPITGALYSHYFAALTALALGIIHVTAGLYVLRRNRRRWWVISALFLAAAIAFIPWLRVFLSGLIQALSESSVRGMNALSASSMVTGLLYLFSNGSTALLILLLFYSWRLRWRNVFVWFWFALVLVLLIGINAHLGVILEIRYLFALWPAVAVLTAFSLDRLRRAQPSLPLGVFVIWIIGGIWMSVSPETSTALSNPHWHLPWREFRAVVLPQALSGDAAIFVLPDWTWAIYHGDELRYYLSDLPLEAALLEQPEHIGTKQYRQVEENAIQNATRVWAASTPAQPLSHFDQFETILAEHDFFHCARPLETDLLHVDLYARISAARMDKALVFGGPKEVRLIPYQALPTTLTSSVLNLTFLWKIADPSQAGLYSVAFHLQDGHGNVVEQIDQGLPTESVACRLYDLDTHVAQPGDYILYVTVYRWETGERLPLLGLNYEVAADQRVILGRFHIEPGN
jgi:hypothetical protein